MTAVTTTWHSTDRHELSDDTIARLDGWWRAANYLSVGPDLPAGQPAAAHAADPRRRQTPPAGPLGHDARAELPLRAPQPGHHGACAVDDLHHRSGPRRPRPGRQRLPGRHLLGGLLRHHAGRRGHRPAVPAVLLPRRDPVARGAGDTGVDPRGRRTRLRPVPRLRCGVRQPRPAGRRGGRRRRGGDRGAGHQLALQQVRQPGQRRRRAADPASQRVQDRQSDGAGPYSDRRAAQPDGGYGHNPYFFEVADDATRRPRRRAPPVRDAARRGARRDRRDSRPRPPRATSSGRSGR